MSIRKKLDALQPRPVKIRVDDWNDTEVYILPFGQDEWTNHLDEEAEHKDDGRLMNAFVQATVMRRLVCSDGALEFGIIDKDGKHLVSDEDLADFGRLSSDGVNFCYHAIVNKHIRHAAMVESAKKNSKKTRR